MIRQYYLHLRHTKPQYATCNRHSTHLPNGVSSGRFQSIVPSQLMSPFHFDLIHTILSTLVTREFRQKSQSSTWVSISMKG
ncbi:hypothetical protein PGB90_003921 [Kerria lacca]